MSAVFKDRSKSASSRHAAAAVAAAIVASLAAVPSGAATEFTVSVAGIAAARGDVRIAVHAAAGEFPDERGAVAKAAIPARPGEIRQGFDLPPGRYAVAVFHDENGNGVLDTNFVGAPKEPYGFSNNVRGRLRAPSFAEAGIMLGTEPLEVKIGIR